MTVKYSGPERRGQTTEEQETHWHLDKKLSLSHLLTTVILAGSLVSWGSAMDRRIAVLEEKSVVHRIDQQRQDEQLAESLKLIREEFRALRDDVRETGRKLDRVLDPRLK